MNNDILTPIFSCKCYEPEGEVNRTVYSMNITPNTLRVLWEKSKVYPTLFNHDINNDFNKFCNLFLSQSPDGSLKSNGIFYVIDNFVGVFYLTDIVPALDADAHYAFFDRRHRGRVDLVKKMLTYLFNEFGFRRLSTSIPSYAHTNINRFVARLGFKQEGTKRDSMLHDGNVFNESLYGILRKDILTGDNLGK